MTPQPPTLSQFYEDEDRLAQNLNNESIEKHLAEIVDFIRREIDENVEALKKRDSTARDSLLMKAILLRRLNRLSNYRNHLLRESLAESRAKVDAHFLQLQNIRCGIAHLRNTIASCLAYQSMDKDLDLVPVEDFYARAPSSISREDVTRADAHQQHLARLEFELEERKIMLSNLQELKGRRSVLLSDIRGKESRLRQTKPLVDSLRRDTASLLEILGVQKVVVTSHTETTDDAEMKDEEEQEQHSSRRHSPRDNGEEDDNEIENNDEISIVEEMQ